MRRVFLFAAFLLLLGLTTAFAASFDVQAEDITSFTTEVSIDVPTKTFKLDGDSGIVPGVLEPDTAKNNTESRDVNPDPASIGTAHLDLTKYYAWNSPPLASPLTVSGQATLLINHNGNGNQLTAGLLRCSEGFDPPRNDAFSDLDAVGVGECVFITEGTTTGTPGSGFIKRSVSFVVPTTTIEVGEWLRLKIVNQSGTAWRVQWGFNPARSGSLELGTS